VISSLVPADFASFRPGAFATSVGSSKWQEMVSMPELACPFVKNCHMYGTNLRSGATAMVTTGSGPAGCMKGKAGNSTLSLDQESVCFL